MNPEEFINLGHALIEDENYPAEVRYRTAIGRIYYGILHHIRLVKKLFYIDTDRLHSDLIDKINVQDSTLGNFLENMKEYRTIADYKLNKEINYRSVEDFLKFFNRVLKRLEKEEI
ncbi:hypothetical protein LCGC14_1277530 [marine sediment metagenome]|uniref:HEPN domain-containing protein n=1 Tax=marine sediment metagenome TaxID=412755 RepID=A0A0F9LHF4_9ZZZZ|nr:hypothetical protein [bacterium]